MKGVWGRSASARSRRRWRACTRSVLLVHPPNRNAPRPALDIATGSSARLVSTQLRQLARAVAALVGLDAHAVEHAQPQVVQRRVAAILEVPARLDAAALAQQQDRQVVVVVAVAVAVAAAVDDQAAIEDVAAALLGRL